MIIRRPMVSKPLTSSKLRPRLAAGSRQAAAQTAPFTVAQVIEAYFERLEHDHSKSIADARNRAEMRILPKLGAILVADLTREKVARWLKEMADRPRYVRGKAGKESRALAAPASDDGGTLSPRLKHCTSLTATRRNTHAAHGERHALRLRSARKSAGDLKSAALVRHVYDFPGLFVDELLLQPVAGLLVDLPEGDPLRRRRRTVESDGT